MKRAICIGFTLLAAGCSSHHATDAAPAADAGGSCPPAFADCDGNAATVCETRIDTDATSCGSCGHACPSGGAHQKATCVGGACGLACEDDFADCDRDPANGCEASVEDCGVRTLATTLAPGGLAVDDANVYYADKGTPPAYEDSVIYRTPKAGGAPATLARNLVRVNSIVVDGGRVYATTSGHDGLNDASVVSVPTAGGPLRVLAAGLPSTATPAVADGRVFFVTKDSPTTGRLLSVHADGSDPAPALAADGVVNETDLEAFGSTLVWSASGAATDGSEAVVESIATDAGGRTVLARGIATPGYRIGMTSDAYLVPSRADGTIRKVPFDTSVAASTFATGVGQPQEVTVDGDVVWITTGSGHSVVRVPVAGGAPTTVVDGQTFPSYSAIDAAYLYWTDGTLAGPATVKKSKKTR